MVHLATQSANAGLDPLNDFQEEEGRPAEIYQQWVDLKKPSSYAVFRAGHKGKGGPFQRPREPPVEKPADDLPKAADLTSSLSASFGLSEEALKAFSAKAVARGQPGTPGTGNANTRVRYKTFNGKAKEEVEHVIDEALAMLAQVSQKHGTDPTLAAKLFVKKLDLFSSSLWDLWQIRQAARRQNLQKNEGGAEGSKPRHSRGEDVRSGEEDDGDEKHGSLEDSNEEEEEDGDEEEEEIAGPTKQKSSEAVKGKFPTLSLVFFAC